MDDILGSSLLVYKARRQKEMRRLLAMMILSKQPGSLLGTTIRSEIIKRLQDRLALRKGLLKQATDEIDSLQKLLAGADGGTDSDQEVADSVYDVTSLE